MKTDASTLAVHEIRMRLAQMSSAERDTMLALMDELQRADGMKGARLADLLETAKATSFLDQPGVGDLFTPNPGPQTAFVKSSVTEILYGGKVGGGKAQPLSATVHTPFGPKKMGDVKVGDQVSNPDGSVARVIAVSPQGVKPIFKITMEDGGATRATGDHLWLHHLAEKVLKADRRYAPFGEADRVNGRVATTDGLRAMMDKPTPDRPLLPLASPVRFTRSFRHDPRKVDPYLLGVLLGDGCRSEDGVRFSNIDENLIEDVGRIAGHGVTGGGGNWRVSEPGELRKALQALALYGLYSYEKFIPECYLYSPVEMRWPLLQGLMDTDGTVDEDGRTSYCTTSPRLAKDVQWLVRSLGGRATISEKEPFYRDEDGEKVPCRTAYNLYIQIRNKADLFRLARKKERCTPYQGGRCEPHSRIVSIEPDGEEEAQCITVDHPNGLYLTDDFIVTHNSAGLLIAAYMHLLRYGSTKSFALIFRRTRAEVVTQPFYLMALESFHVLKSRGFHAEFNKTELTWNLGPVGNLRFGYLESDGDEMRYQGSEIIFLGFDEATHFRPYHYTYMFSRLRAPVPTVVRASTNPGGPHHAFFHARFAPWINRKPEYLDKVRRGAAMLAEPGEVLWVKKEEKSDVELYFRTPEEGCLSRTYMPASMEDTPQFDHEQYKKSLAALDVVTRARLSGDWDIEPESGKFFNRGWFPKISRSEFMEKGYNVGQTVSKWDFAWTKKKKSDNTCNLHMIQHVLPTGSCMYIIDRVMILKTTPNEVEQQLLKKAADDKVSDKIPTKIVIPEDPSSGKYTAFSLVRLLAGYNVTVLKEDGNKKARAMACAAAAERREIYLVEDPVWNEPFLNELHNFTGKDGEPDDQVDCLSGAYNFITMGEQEDLLVPSDLQKMEDRSRSHPHTEEVVKYPARGAFKLDEMIAEIRIKKMTDWAPYAPLLSPDMPRHLHIELGPTGRAGMVMAHVSSWRRVDKKVQGSSGEEYAPMIVVDFALAFEATGMPLPLSELRANAYMLGEKGYGISSISFSPSQELEGVPAVGQHGYHGVVVDVNKDDAAAYRHLRVAISEGRVSCYNYPPLLEELESLRWNIRGRLVEAPLGRREVADALAAVSLTLGQMKVGHISISSPSPDGNPLLESPVQFEPFMMGEGRSDEDAEWLAF